MLLDKLAEARDGFTRLVTGLYIHAGNQHSVHAHFIYNQIVTLLDQPMDSLSGANIPLFSNR